MSFGKPSKQDLNDRLGPGRIDPVIDYILANAKDDERPYLRVQILGRPLLGLLDSGASRTIIGAKGWEFFKSLGFKLSSKEKLRCTVANGQEHHTIGSIEVPFELQGVVKLLTVLVMPDLKHTLILGVDFFKLMGVVPDLRRGEWQFLPEISSVDTLEPTSELTLKQKAALKVVLDEYFAKMGTGLGRARGVKHRIRTSHEPIKQRYYPVSPAIQKNINKELDEMLRLGVIEKSTSAWSSPILLVPKKDGTSRFCVDFRKLNEVSERDAYPLPWISHTLDKLRGAMYLSSVDIKSAYWQIEMEEESKPCTAFTVPGRGLFHFCRMPFGLHNSPATWQRFLDEVLGPELEPYVFKYLDDIIIISRSYEEHLRILEEVLKRLCDAGLTISRDKCKFCLPELKYLGYVVNRHGLNVDPDKVEAIVNIPTPTTVTEVRRVLGMASWYRRFIPNFSTIIAPMTKLLRKKARFTWDGTCDQAWKHIKEKLITAPIITCPDYQLPFCIQTDASAYGIAGVLTQQQEEGEKVIAYISRSLNKAEKNYSTTERECLAVLWSIEKLRPYIEGTEFTVITDHHSLTWLHKLKDPSGRLARWAVRLQQYSFKIIHRSGKENVVPDALSRAVPSIDIESVDIADCTDKWYNRMRLNIETHPLKFPAWRVTEGRLYHYQKNIYPALTDENEPWKLVIPRQDRKRILETCHNNPTAGHVGVYKTYHRIAQKYYWPKLRSDVARYVRRCEICLATKPERKLPAGLMAERTTVDRPWKLISADLMGPLPRTRSGYQYILSVLDIFSKFTLLFPLRTATVPSIIRHLENDVFLMFGVSDRIIVDNGTQFRSKEFRKLMSDYGVQISYTALYHAQANPTERANGVVKQMLRAYVSDKQTTWEYYLPKLACAMRTATHETTRLTPFFVNFGREFRFPDRHAQLTAADPEVKKPMVLERRVEEITKMREEVKLRIQKASARNKKHYDLRRRDIRYHPGEQVWRRNHILSDATKHFNAKLAPRYVGPFQIKKILSPWTYELVDMDGRFRGNWHAKDLKPNPSDVELDATHSY